MPVRLADLAAAAEAALGRGLASADDAPRLGPRLGGRLVCPFAFVDAGGRDRTLFLGDDLGDAGDALVEAEAVRLAAIAPEQVKRLIVRAEG